MITYSKILQHTKKEGIFIDNWSPDCRIYKKKLSSSFLKNAKFVDMDQITSKNYNKSSWMQVNKILLTRNRSEQFPSFFVCTFQWNQTTMGRSRVSNAYQFLKILPNCVDSVLLHCFLWLLKLRVKIFRKHSHRICWNFAIMEAIMAGTYSRKRFLQKTPGTEKHKDK